MNLANSGTGWLDGPVLMTLHYFESMFYFFISKARILGNLMALIGIFWQGLQLIFSTTSTRKTIISLLMSWLMFFFVLNFYQPVIYFIKNTVTDWGLNATPMSKKNLTTKLTGFLNALESDVEKQRVDAALEVEKMFSDLDESELRKNYETYKKYNYSGVHVSNPDEILEKRKDRKQKEIEQRNASIDDGWQLRTLNSLKSILKPVDINGESGKSIAKAYVLDLTLSDGKNKETGYVSPSAVLKLGLLTAQLMYESETQIISENMDERRETKSKNDVKKTIPLLNLSLDEIFKFILTCLCCLGIVLACVFAIVQYVMCIFEYSIITSIGIIFVPMALFEGTKDMAQKILPAILGLSVKMLVITICIMFTVTQYLELAFSQITDDSVMNLVRLGYVAFMILISWVLTQNAPQLAVTLLTGNPQLSMGEVVHAVGTGMALGHATRSGMGAVTGAAQGGANALRGGINGLQNATGTAAEMYGASRGASGAVKDSGGSKSTQVAAGLKAAGKVIADSAKQGIQNSAHNFMHPGSKGGGGTGSNSLNLNDANIMGKVGDHQLSELQRTDSGVNLHQRDMANMKKETKPGSQIYRSMSFAEKTRSRITQAHREAYINHRNKSKKE